MISGGAAGAKDVVSVENRTGLDGRYNLSLDVELDSAGGVFQSVSPGAARQALQTQLGLTIAETKISVATAVIDHVERMPTAN